MSQLSKRLSVLEAAQNPAGQIIGFWAMTDDCEPMTDREIEKEIAVRKASAPGARILPITWLSPIDPV